MYGALDLGWFCMLDRMQRAQSAATFGDRNGDAFPDTDIHGDRQFHSGSDAQRHAFADADADGDSYNHSYADIDAHAERHAISRGRIHL